MGHCTVEDGSALTGVTAVLPSPGNVFAAKLPAAAVVLNGYGKSTGLIQIEELGLLESPILHTNTLNVGLVSDALVDWTIRVCVRDGIDVTSFNPAVCECNDSYLSDIRLRAVKGPHVLRAIGDAREDFEEGDVGAGKGMSCHGLKGGIGSASRTVGRDGHVRESLRTCLQDVWAHPFDVRNRSRHTVRPWNPTSNGGASTT